MKKQRLVKLPEIIHVRIERPDRDEPYLVATERGIYGALDGDGPELIGKYKLEKVYKAKRVVQWEESKEHS